MSCPTCDHAMKRVLGGVGVFWCPRCGTVKTELRQVGDAFFHDPLVPKLVERCRKLPTKGDGTNFGEWLDRLGITESIYPPNRREARS